MRKIEGKKREKESRVLIECKRVNNTNAIVTYKILKPQKIKLPLIQYLI